MLNRALSILGFLWFVPENSLSINIMIYCNFCFTHININFAHSFLLINFYLKMTLSTLLYKVTSYTDTHTDTHTHKYISELFLYIIYVTKLKQGYANVFLYSTCRPCFLENS